jgi:hypothetical protein
MVMINDKPHITLIECAKRLGIGYRAAYAYVMAHSEIPRQKIGRQFFVCFDDLSKHPRYVKRDSVLV